MFRSTMGKISKTSKQIVIFLISCYQNLVSPFLGQHCRFQPSCSSYAKEAIVNYGLLYGSWLAIKRLAKCHPWNPGGFDPVPTKQTRN
jgi:uncharacterized protein